MGLWKSRAQKEVERLEAEVRLARADIQLKERIAALEKQATDEWAEIEREQQERAVRDAAEKAERLRAERHHEVFLEVIKVLAGPLPWPQMSQNISDRVETARVWADLAYPKVQA